MSSIKGPSYCPHDGCPSCFCNHTGWRRDDGHLFKVFQCSNGHIFFVHWDHARGD